MDYETTEDMKTRWDREEKAATAKAQRSWEKYRTLKPSEKSVDRKGQDQTLVFEDWVKETDCERRIKTTTFRLTLKGEVLHAWTRISKSQKFLAVNGPLVGQRITDENEDYQLYNIAGREYPTPKHPAPQCVLVHKRSLKT